MLFGSHRGAASQRHNSVPAPFPSPFFSLPAESKRKFPQINTKALDVPLMAFQGKEA